ncbi:MAG: pentapeptide repeat-containing protein, partial [Clostridia bacterium]|nr:pentapeptide repeat-containing protein [Clostridia bacterium]
FFNHGFFNRGFLNHGFFNHGFLNHGFFNHGFFNHGFFNHGLFNRGFFNHRLLCRFFSQREGQAGNQQSDRAQDGEHLFELLHHVLPLFSSSW